jgi:hypothetical protein
MPRQTPVYAWVEQVVTVFPHLSRPQATVLALYSFGAILAQRCGLNSVATALVPLLGVKFLTIRSRLSEFYQPATAKSGAARRQLDVTACFAPLLAWVLKGWPATRLALALDATDLGARFTVLSLSVVYRGSAIPVAWKVLPANVHHAWKPEWIALLRSFSQRLPPGWTVILMTDRALYARWMFQEIVALGWHPLLRITRMSKFRTAGSKADRPVTAFAPKPGCRWQGRGVAFPRKPQRRLPCTLLACWEPGHDEAWFVVTDLDPDRCEGLWYGMRSWIEQGFKLLKRGGWQWQASRMTDPERAARLWLVLAVATRSVLAVGGQADADEPAVETIPEPSPTRPARRRPTEPERQAASPHVRPPAPRRRATGTKQRLVSVFRQGLAALVSILIAGHPLQAPHWKPEPWLEIRAENTRPAPQPPTPIPKNPYL